MTGTVVAMVVMDTMLAAIGGSGRNRLGLFFVRTLLALQLLSFPPFSLSLSLSLSIGSSQPLCVL
jgi:hypothetical protein